MYWGAVFLRLEEEYWRSPFFLINFIGVNFEAGNETREKIWSDLVAEQKWRAERKEWFFVHTAVFERTRNWCVKKFSLSERNFFVHVRLLKAVFFCNFSCLWGLIMILYWIWARSDRNWRFQVVNLSFMQIWRFLISFADFSTKFIVYWPFVLFYCFKCNLHRSALFKDHRGYKSITILLL